MIWFLSHLNWRFSFYRAKQCIAWNTLEKYFFLLPENYVTQFSSKSLKIAFHKEKETPFKRGNLCLETFAKTWNCFVENCQFLSRILMMFFFSFDKSLSSKYSRSSKRLRQNLRRKVYFSQDRRSPLCYRPASGGSPLKPHLCGGRKGGEVAIHSDHRGRVRAAVRTRCLGQQDEQNLLAQNLSFWMAGQLTGSEEKKKENYFELDFRLIHSCMQLLPEIPTPS